MSYDMSCDCSHVPLHHSRNKRKINKRKINKNIRVQTYHNITLLLEFKL